MIKKILVLSANPKDTSRLRIDQEVREIENGLQRSQHHDKFMLKCSWATRCQDIRRAMLDFDPNIVHFSGHGEGDAGIVLEDETGQTQLVREEALAGLFELFAEHVECVVLNACYSHAQAQAIARHIQYVIGMNKSIGDKTAIEFSTAFYDALGAGKSIEFAYRLGCNAIQFIHVPDQSVPVLITKTNNLQEDDREMGENTEYQAFTSEELLKLGTLDPEKIAEELIEMDYEYMTGLQEIHEGSMELLMHRWLSYPETGKIIMYNKMTPVGYWHAVPLFEAIFEQFKAGKGFDGKLTPDLIERIEDPGVYHLYFSGIGIRRGHNNITVRRLLILSFIDALEHLAQQGVFFIDFCANALTEDGKAICSHFEMRKIIDHCDKGEIYYRRLYPFPALELFKKRTNLIKLYASKFGQV